MNRDGWLAALIPAARPARRGTQPRYRRPPAVRHDSRLWRPSPVPKGPQGRKRSADPVANAIRVTKILTGEIEEDMGDSGKDKAAQSLGRKGGAARREKLSPERRAQIARTATEKRWGKHRR
jgi:hypothetical protein